MKELQAKRDGIGLTAEEEELRLIVEPEYVPGDVAVEFMRYQEAERKKQEAEKKGEATVDPEQ